MQASTFRVERATGDDGRCVVRVAGEIDLYTAADLRAELRAALGDDPSALVIDLTATSFLDSSGLAAMLGAYRGARLRHCALEIVVDDAHVRRPLEVAGLDDLVPVLSGDEARGR